MIERTERLRYEALSEAHAAAMWPVLMDERIYHYIPDVRYATVEALQSRYCRLAAGSPSPEEEVWWNFIMFRQGSPTPIGYVQATLLPVQRTAEVAYVLSPAHWGQGYATEALAWLLTKVHQRGFDRARAQIDERNKASIALVQRLGFALTSTVVEEACTDLVFERALLNLVAADHARCAD